MLLKSLLFGLWAGILLILLDYEGILSEISEYSSQNLPSPSALVQELIEKIQNINNVDSPFEDPNPSFQPDINNTGPDTAIIVDGNPADITRPPANHTEINSENASDNTDKQKDSQHHHHDHNQTQQQENDSETKTENDDAQGTAADDKDVHHHHEHKTDDNGSNGAPSEEINNTPGNQEEAKDQHHHHEHIQVNAPPQQVEAPETVELEVHQTAQPTEQQTPQETQQQNQDEANPQAEKKPKKKGTKKTPQNDQL